MGISASIPFRAAHAPSAQYCHFKPCSRASTARALKAAAGAAPGGGGEAEVHLVENDAEETDGSEKARDRKLTEANLAEVDFSSFQDERSSPVGSLAGTAAPTRKSRANKHSIPFATSTGVMLASLGTAAHHSGDAIASAKEAAAQAAAFAAAKEAPQQQQQENIDLHLADSISSLRFLLKSARDRANAMTNEAKAILQRSSSNTELGDAEIGVLHDERTKAYRITRKALKTSIAARAGNAEEAMKKLEKLPPLRRKDDGHLVSQARGYIRFIESQAKR
ncbi:hypothetical protein Esti_002296 [Eimeria stiedai]